MSETLNLFVHHHAAALFFLVVVFVFLINGCAAGLHGTASIVIVIISLREGGDQTQVLLHQFVLLLIQELQGGKG